MLSCGIIGLPMAGKTTLFNLLTHRNEEVSEFFSGRTKTNIGMAMIPDYRIDELSKVYKPKKEVYATLEVVDVAGLVKGSSSGAGVGNKFIEDLRKVEALLHVVRVFENPDIAHAEDSIDPIRDIETINMELLLADLDFVEKRIQRINESKKVTPAQKLELPVMEAVHRQLGEEIPFSQIVLNDEQREILRPYHFLTNTPMIIVLNIDESQLSSRDYPGRAEIMKYAEDRGLIVLESALQTEAEIMQLDAESQSLFWTELGIEQPGTVAVARAMYDILDLISFFTVGNDEVRAWTIDKGLNAQQAAGKIHSDLERGFIRAETVAFSDFAAAGYSMNKVKESGLWRLEGKNYIVQDGDILTIRFNV